MVNGCQKRMLKIRKYQAEHGADTLPPVVLARQLRRQEDRASRSAGVVSFSIASSDQGNVNAPNIDEVENVYPGKDAWANKFRTETANDNTLPSTDGACCDVISPLIAQVGPVKKPLMYSNLGQLREQAEAAKHKASSCARTT
eukprot:GEMP01124049.1.p2 GENE.GEMP01124049.1~~GEMP01124049.1.p2  ORF type:complete len:156 (+),score=25.31 GEMP01124049.1:40-468(+)